MRVGGPTASIRLVEPNSALPMRTAKADKIDEWKERRKSEQLDDERGAAASTPSKEGPRRCDLFKPSCRTGCAVQRNAQQLTNRSHTFAYLLLQPYEIHACTSCLPISSPLSEIQIRCANVAMPMAWQHCRGRRYFHRWDVVRLALSRG